MSARYTHTSIVSDDWERLARFYENVFRCRRVPPTRAFSGPWLARGAGVADAALEGVHLRLPGHGPAGPTLEIYTYARSQERPAPVANRRGLRHLGFEVEDVEGTLASVVRHGGSALGEVTRARVEGVGAITFVYAADPDGNIVELQRWDEEHGAPSQPDADAGTP